MVQKGEIPSHPMWAVSKPWAVAVGNDGVATPSQRAGLPFSLLSSRSPSSSPCYLRGSPAFVLAHFPEKPLINSGTVEDAWKDTSERSRKDGGALA